MTPQDHHSPEQTGDLDSELRQIAAQTHPRRAFTAALRSELEQQSANPRQRGWSWLRPWIAQAGSLALLVGLVLVALQLAPRLLREPAPLQEEAGTPTPLPPGETGQPTAQPGFLPALPNGALARLGKGTLTALTSTDDGRLVAASTTGVCLYGQGLMIDWCAWTDSVVLEVDASASGANSNFGAFIAAGLADGRVLILDHYTGRLIAERTFEGGSITGLACDPYGAPIVAVGALASQVSAWNWKTDHFAWGPAGTNGDLQELDWTVGPEGTSRIALTDAKGIVVLNGETGEVLRRRDAPETRHGPLIFLNGGRQIAVALNSYGEPWRSDTLPPIRVETLNTDNLDTLQHWQIPGLANALVFIPLDRNADSMLAVSTMDTEGKSAVSLLAEESDQPSQNFPAGQRSPLAWMNERLYYGDPIGTLSYLENGQPVFLNGTYTTALENLTWPSANEVISGNTASIHRWVANTGEVGAVSEVHGPDSQLVDQALQFALSADGQHAAYYLHKTDQVMLLNVAENQAKGFIDVPSAPTAATYDPTASRLALAFQNGTIAIYDSQTGELQRTAQFYQPDATINELAWGPTQPSHDPLLIAWSQTNGIGGIDELTVSGITAGQIRNVTTSDTITEMAISPDGQWVAGLLMNTEARVWNAATGEERYRFGKDDLRASIFEGSIAFSPDSRLIAASGRGYINVFDLASGQTLHTFTGHNDFITALAFRPDGLALASGSEDGAIILWDLGAGPLPEITPEPTPTPLPPPTQAPVE